MKRSFAIIFMINMVLRVILQGLLPIFPVITEKLGATKQVGGMMIAASYAMLLLGTFLSGKLIPRYTNAKTLLIVTVIPLCLAMAIQGQMTGIAGYVSCSMALFFFSGINMMAGIFLIGNFSDTKTVGKNFGIIGISSLLGSLIGGFVTGPVLYRFGFQTGFLLFSGAMFATCLSGFLIDKPAQSTSIVHTERFRMTKRFALMLLSYVMAVMLIHVFLFSFSLSMKSAGYNISQISLYSALGTALILPVPYLLGKWTATYSPKRILILVYFLIGLALLFLLIPKSNLVIVMAVPLMSVLTHSGRAIAIPLIFPWFTDKQLPMAQAYLGTAAWLAAIIGYSGIGFSLEQFGLVTTIVIGTSIALLAIIILAQIPATPDKKNEELYHNNTTNIEGKMETLKSGIIVDQEIK